MLGSRLGGLGSRLGGLGSGLGGLTLNLLLHLQQQLHHRFPAVCCGGAAHGLWLYTNRPREARPQQVAGKR